MGIGVAKIVTDIFARLLLELLLPLVELCLGSLLLLARQEERRQEVAPCAPGGWGSVQYKIRSC